MFHHSFCLFFYPNSRRCVFSSVDSKLAVCCIRLHLPFVSACAFSVDYNLFDMFICSWWCKSIKRLKYISSYCLCVRRMPASFSHNFAFNLFYHQKQGRFKNLAKWKRHSGYRQSVLSCDGQRNIEKKAASDLFIKSHWLFNLPICVSVRACRQCSYPLHNEKKNWIEWDRKIEKKKM